MPERTATLIQPTSRSLLARILDEPDLPATIQELPPLVLGRLIDRVGLEDAGEIVALATTEQIAHVFDEDLWKNDRPGQEERFDAERFLVWLEVMLEAGDAFAAQRLSELPEDLVTLALHRQILVLDVDALAAEMEDAGEDADLTDKALQSCLYEELDSYQIISRHHEGWDSVLAVVLALDRDHHDFLVRVLDRCCAMTSEYIESNGGLQEVLTSDEVLEGDVAGDREDRRAEAGYVAPTAARSFLELARADATVPPTEHDAVTRAYFRGLSRKPALTRPARPAPAAPGGGLRALLAEEGITAPPAAPMLPAGPGRAAAGPEPLLVTAMRRLAAEDPARFEERTEELAYLANVLVAGASFRGRRLRPVEAAAAVIAACSEGLRLALDPAAPAAEAPRAKAPRGKATGTKATGTKATGIKAPGGDARERALREQAWTALRDHPADGLFRLAWRSVDRDALLAAAVRAGGAPRPA